MDEADAQGFIVLDEVDHMLNTKFLEDIRALIEFPRFTTVFIFSIRKRFFNFFLRKVTDNAFYFLRRSRMIFSNWLQNCFEINLFLPQTKSLSRLILKLSKTFIKSKQTIRQNFFWNYYKKNWMGME